MNETENVKSAAQESHAAHTTPSAAQKSGMASTLYDVGMTWAQAGIGFGKTALETSARALERTAKRLGELQTQIKRDSDKPSN